MRFFVFYIIFLILSFNAYGMMPEEEKFHHNNHPLMKLREEVLQTLNILQEGLMLYQGTIQTLQESGQKIYMPEGHEMVLKKSTKEILDQDTPSLNALHTYTMETLAIIKHIQRNTQRMCAPEAVAKMCPESQAEQTTLLELFLNVPSKECPMIKKRMVVIKSAIEKHTEEIKKKQGSGLKHHNGPLEINKKTEECLQTELENYRKVANLFIGNNLKIEDPQPLKTGFFKDYKLSDGKKPIDRRLVDNLFSKTKELLEHFPDYDLLSKLALLLVYSDDPDRDEKALGLCARAICSEFKENIMYEYTTIKMFMKLLTTYPNEKANRCKTARSLVELILKPKEEIQLIQKKNIQKTKLSQTKNSFLNYCESLFSVLSGPNKSLKNDYACALYHSINFLTEKSNYDRQYFMDALSTKLYNTYDPENLPVFIKFHYTHALAGKERYSEAIEVSKTLLTECKSSNFDVLIYGTYFSMASMYTLISDYPQALQALECGFASRDNSDDQSMHDEFFYSFLALMSDPTKEEALTFMKNIVELPTHEKKNAGLKPYLIDVIYQCFLEKAGKLDELTELLLKKQEKILAKRFSKEKKQANAIKKFQAENKEKDLCRQYNTNNNTTNTPPQKPRTLNTTAMTSTTTSSTSLFTDMSSQKEKYVVPEVKEKMKTRPETSPTQQVIKEALSLNQIENTHHIYMEDLTQNKNARKTFNKLFTFHQKKDCFDNEVKISLNEINSLFLGLNQKIDFSQGKGSHTKVTLNFQEAGEVIEEQMIILTKTTYLKEYQIKQIREKFVKSGVVPNDSKVIFRLKADGWLD